MSENLTPIHGYGKFEYPNSRTFYKTKMPILTNHKKKNFFFLLKIANDEVCKLKEWTSFSNLIQFQ